MGLKDNMVKYRVFATHIDRTGLSDLVTPLKVVFFFCPFFNTNPEMRFATLSLVSKAKGVGIRQKLTM